MSGSTCVTERVACHWSVARASGKRRERVLWNSCKKNCVFLSASLIHRNARPHLAIRMIKNPLECGSGLDPSECKVALCDKIKNLSECMTHLIGMRSQCSATRIVSGRDYNNSINLSSSGFILARKYCISRIHLFLSSGRFRCSPLFLKAKFVHMQNGSCSLE